MNPLMWPTFPPTRIVPPFSEIPARDDASPSMTIVPPRLDAPAHSEALPSTRTDPACRFSPTDQPVKPCTTTSGPSPRPPMKYPALPSISIRTRLLRPTARLWRPRGPATGRTRRPAARPARRWTRGWTAPRSSRSPAPYVDLLRHRLEDPSAGNPGQPGQGVVLRGHGDVVGC